MAARIVGRLKARQVANAKPPRDKDRIDIPDGGNLLLQVTRGKGGHVRRSWCFKYELSGQRHELGLGPTHTIGLAEARDRARAMRQMLLDGLDPLVERRKRQQELIAERAKAVTFREVAQAYLDLHLDSFKNAKHRYQWRATLATYVYPKIGAMTVADIGPADVLRCVEPIWREKRGNGFACAATDRAHPRLCRYPPISRRRQSGGARHRVPAQGRERQG